MTISTKILFVTVIAAVVIGGRQPARADWINRTSAETAPNIAEIYVLDDRVRVKLESTSAISINSVIWCLTTGCAMPASARVSGSVCSGFRVRDCNS